LVEQRSPKPQVGGSIPSWPAIQNIQFFKKFTQSHLMSAQAESQQHKSLMLLSKLSLLSLWLRVTAFYYFSELFIALSGLGACSIGAGGGFYVFDHPNRKKPLVVCAGV
jgi:hypothetical protein